MKVLHEQTSNLCISKIALFQELPIEDQKALMGLTIQRELKEGEILKSPGEALHEIIILRHGKIKLSTINEDGREHISEIFVSTDVIGEETLFSEKKAGMFLTAITDIKICLLESRALENYIREHPEFGIRVIHALAERLRESRESLSLVSIEDAARRLAAFIERRSRYLGSDTIELSRQTIASSIGLSRETISRKLTELKDRGLICLKGYRKITILDHEKLKNF